jgi:casein kinase 1
MRVVVGSKYLLGRKIGSGAFGDVYLSTHIETNEEFAVKLEAIDCADPHLMHEAKVYKVLEGAVGVPKLHWYGVEGDFNVMVLDLLGPSLQDLFAHCDFKFSLKTLVMLADQMVNRIEYMHRKNLIHRDIAPDNFLMGVGKKSTQVHLVDFGLTKCYRSAASHAHMPYKEDDTFSGTFEYLSLNAQRGVEHSRRDDLESLCYVLLHFSPGGLPWEHVEATSEKEWHRKVSAVKKRTPVEDLCSNVPNSSAPNVVDACMTECRSGDDIPKPLVKMPRALPRRTYKARFAERSAKRFHSN